MSDGVELRASLRPAWLRPAALAFTLAAHVLLLVVVRSESTDISPIDSLEVSLVPRGDSAEDQIAQQEIEPQEIASPPVQQADVPPPQQIAPDAPALPQTKPDPSPQPVQKSKRDKPERKTREIAEQRREEQQARQAMHRGAETGTESPGMGRAEYASLLIAELNRHKFFPAAARASGVTGSVGVAFTVGASGRVISQMVTRSSGVATLDDAAHAMMSAISAPPPPGGSFSTRTTIHFYLN